MTKTPILATLIASLALTIAACGEVDGNDPATFKANLEAAIKAADEGKHLVKSPPSRRRG